MNNVFDFQRFGNYFLYDLRRAKNNYAISLLVIGLLPVALYLITQFFSLISGNGVTELSEVPKFIAVFAGIVAVRALRSRVTFAPKHAANSNMRPTSAMSGTFSRVTVSSERSAAAIIGSAAFLLPGTR